jgi:hypothetical protein
VELEPRRDEVSRQARLPQSFLLSEVIRTPSMVPTPSIEPTVGPMASTSRVVDTNVPLSVMSRMATSVLGSPSSSANNLMALGVDLTPIFWLTSTLCERGNVAATSAEVCEGVDVGQPMARDVVVE